MTLKRLPLAALAAAVLAAVLAAALLADTSAPTLGERAQASARSFLERYVAPSGQVIRRDQGSDSVSEGQAYGLLLAEVAGDQSAFQRIWAWTRRHMQLPDGLFAWHVSPTGAVLDRGSAADADVLIAWALSRASGPGAGAYRRQARRIAAAVLTHETAQLSGGAPVLTAGPWASSPHPVLNPSYWSQPAFAGLARFTGDSRWEKLKDSASGLTAVLTNDGRQLPPDWSQLTLGGAEPASQPGGGAGIQYGLDAARLPVWFAASCRRSDRALAARFWLLLEPLHRTRAIAMTQSGQVLSSYSNALPYIAAAASATAAGDRAAATRLLADARRVQAAHRTYYGAAWLALGQTLLAGALGTCAHHDNSGGA